tara:strand:+ start:419 stop:1123 length:705 start_codon:yes stop_codon:yes gene_type:complete
MKIIHKIKKNLIRFNAKVSDKLFKTTKFDLYQRRYSKIYENNYKLTKNQFSFVHIPRTGGTSLHSLLLENRKDFYGGIHSAVSLLCNPKEFKYITVIREPIERVYSFYLMQKKYKKLPFNVHAEKGLEFFLKNVWNCRNGICKFINGNIKNEVNEELYKISIENMKNFYFVLDFENFNRDVDVLSSKLNIKNKIQYTNNYKTTKENFSKENKELIKKYNLYDSQLYDEYRKYDY